MSFNNGGEKNDQRGLADGLHLFTAGFFVPDYLEGNFNMAAATGWVGQLLREEQPALLDIWPLSVLPDERDLAHAVATIGRRIPQVETGSLDARQN